ncbi:MAG: LysR family transcriptional regulator [Paracoccaceae bacterium]|nr:LysR family transcriptional regulator [Paracoccaceae bacterium]
MNRTIDWNDQRAFLAVLDAGSLSAAARQMGVAQPTMRARIEALEQALGVRLFTRSVRGLVPTAEARALGDAARAMARASDAFVRAAASPPGLAEGVVRISVSDFIGLEVLPAMLVPLRQGHPALRLEIDISNAPANVLEQEVDVAVRMYPPRQEALVAQKVPAIRLGLFAHAGYLESRGMPKTADDLRDHDLIGPDRSPAERQLARALFPGLDDRRFVIRTDNHPAQLAAARAGLGIALMQRAIGRRDPQLREVLPGLAPPSLDAWIVTHDSLRTLPRVRVVFDHLVAAFRAYGKDAVREVGR